MVSHRSLSVNMDCDTIPQLSNYSTKYFLHFSDEKCETIHDTLKEHTQFSQKKYSVTFTSEKTSYPSQTQNHYYYAIYNSCKFGMLDGTYYFMDQQRQYKSSVFQNTSSKCKSAWLINNLSYYDSHLHLPFQLQLLQYVS